MTQGMKLPPLLTAQPDEVGRAVRRAEAERRDVLYVRAIWRPVMAIICLLPERLFKRMRLLAMAPARVGVQTSSATSSDIASPIDGASRVRQRGVIVATVLAAIVAVLCARARCRPGRHWRPCRLCHRGPYTDLALAQQIAQGHYGLAPGESAAPASSILFPFLLAAFVPLGLGALAPLVINAAATLAAGVFALLLAKECGLPLRRIRLPRLFVAAAAVTLALNLAGLALTGLEHSLHVALTIVYLLGLVRFVRRGSCDWWWFLCILVQPLIRFEAAGMLVADVLIFLSFRRYGYALVTVLIGIALVGGYSLFLHAIGLPLLPSSVLARSEWSNAAVATQSGIVTVFSAILHNFHDNLNSFGAAQMLGALPSPCCGSNGCRCCSRDAGSTNPSRPKLMTIFFMSFVTLAQLVGGKIGWIPPRYEAYVLALNLCGLVIVYREKVGRLVRPGKLAARGVVLDHAAADLRRLCDAEFRRADAAQKEYRGPFQLHRFVTEFLSRAGRRRPARLCQLRQSLLRARSLGSRLGDGAAGPRAAAPGRMDGRAPRRARRQPGHHQ